MLTDTLRTLALLATFLCTDALSSANPVQEGPLIFPVFRYAKYQGDEFVSEYVGAPDGPFIDNFRQLPKANGPMEVNCQTVSEIGIVIEPVGSGGWIYGAKRKYHFEWAHSSEPPGPVRRMQYHRNTPYGFLRNGIKLVDWLVDGTIRLTISVTGEAVYETHFRLTNCDANLYRTPTPPSEMRRERGANDGNTASRAEDLP